MRNVQKMLCGAVALLATAAVGQSHAAVGAPVTGDDARKQINKCMAMSADALAADTDCTDIMKQNNVTVAEMQTMKTCKSMKPDMMAKDDTCTSLSDKH